MTKEERLEFIRKRFNELKKAEGVDGGGVMHSSSRDIKDEVDRLRPFQEEQRDRKRERNVINSDD